MGMGGGGGGGPQQTTTTIQKYPNYVVPFAKAYLSSLASLVFPGMTIPNTYLPKGYNFGGGGGGAAGQGAGAGGAAGGGATPPPVPGIDPSVMYNFGNPMIAGSSYLQNLAQQNPAEMAGAMSPMAANQLAFLYPGMLGGSGGQG